MRYSKSSNNKNKIVNWLKQNWLISLILVLVLYFLPSVFRYLKSLKDSLEVKSNLSNLKNESANSANENTYASTAKLNDKEKKLRQKTKRKYPNLSDLKLRELTNNAFNIAIALGQNATSNRPWFDLSFLPDRPDPDAWFEDEEAAKKILKKHPGTFPLLAEYYNSLATRNQDLRKDIHNKLSKSDIDEVRKHWKKFGNYNWL